MKSTQPSLRFNELLDLELSGDPQSDALLLLRIRLVLHSCAVPIRVSWSRPVDGVICAFENNFPIPFF
jgi:hypothetical protein